MKTPKQSRSFINKQRKAKEKRKEERWIGVWGDGITTRVCNTKADADFEVYRMYCAYPLPEIDYHEI